MTGGGGKALCITSTHCDLFYNNTTVTHSSEVFFKITEHLTTQEFAFESAELSPLHGFIKVPKPQLEPLK